MPGTLVLAEPCSSLSAIAAVSCVYRGTMKKQNAKKSFKKKTIFQLVIRQCSKHSDPHLRIQGTKSLVDIGFRLSSSARNSPNEQNAEALQRWKIPTLPALDLQTARTPGLCRIARTKSGQDCAIFDPSCIFSWVDFPVGGGCLLMRKAELDNRTNVVALEPINCRCREGQSIRGSIAGFLSSIVTVLSPPWFKAPSRDW
jgi:hypothetical protein